MDHKQIVLNSYKCAAHPLLLGLSLLYRTHRLPPDFTTAEMITTWHISDNCEFHIEFTHKEGNVCLYVLSDEGCNIHLTTPPDRPRAKQAIGLPYFFHRLVLLYSKTLRSPTKGI